MTRPGGFVVVSVPALPGIYSEFDRIQGHRRRYLPQGLIEAFADSDLELERVFWWGRWLVPDPREAAGEEPDGTGRIRLGRLPALPQAAVLAALDGGPPGVRDRKTTGDQGTTQHRHLVIRRGQASCELLNLES